MDDRKKTLGTDKLKEIFMKEYRILSTILLGILSLL